MKRLLIYFFYDKEGIVDDYIPFFLKAARGVCQDICFVVNGELSAEGRRKVEPLVSKILIRENEGMDAAAYQAALFDYGFEKLAEYDEVVCTNFTFFGPFFSLEEMFSTMQKRECDWWTMYKWPIKYDFPFKFEYCHIPSGFSVYRQSLVSSSHFRRYWETLSDTDTYDNSVMFHEQRQTPYYDKLGYVGEAYIDCTPFRIPGIVHFPLQLADRVLIYAKAPLLKRRVFFPGGKTKFPYARAAGNILQWLPQNSSYPIALMYDNLERTVNPHYPFPGDRG